MTKLSIVIPCYHNEKNISPMIERLIKCEAQFDAETVFEYLFVDDGSKDNTFAELKKAHRQFPDKVKAVRLTRNFGSHNAVLAGLSQATGNCHAVLCADLQDPPELIPQLYTFWKEGTKLALANHVDSHEPFISKSLSRCYHFLMKKFFCPNAPQGGFDLCLMDDELRLMLINIKENNVPLDYYLIRTGADYKNIPYVKQKRKIGISQWTLSKKIKLFIDSFIAFSGISVRRDADKVQEHHRFIIKEILN